MPNPLAAFQRSFESAASKLPSLAESRGRRHDFSKTRDASYRDPKTASLFALWMDAYSLAKEESSAAINQTLFT